MDSNNLYVILSIIIFIYLYFSISYKSSEYSITEDNNDKVLIEINANVIKVDKKNIYTHLMLVKENLKDMDKRNFSYDIDVANQINRLAKLSCVDLNKFKIANKYAQMAGSLDDPRSHVRDITRSDISSTETDLKPVILNVEIALFLLKQDPTGHLILTHLHALIKFFSEISHGENYISYDEIFIVNEMPQHTLAHSNVRTQNRHGAFSQNNMGGFGTEDYDGEDFVNDENNIILPANTKVKLCDKKELYTAYNTQMFGSSDKRDNSNKGGFKYFVPFCNIDKLKQENKRNKVFVDPVSRQSLRNDYT
jgi:hypothetical protein